MLELNGVINIYKPRGYTSHDIVMKVRKILKIKRIGHAGTLDPDAEGILTVCIGKGTKLVEFMTEKDKEYVATVKLGIITDTQDITGQVLEQMEVVNINDENIDNVLSSFKGEYWQVPPMYSAIKVGGRKLYELAREGKEIEREARKVYIKEIEFLDRPSKDEFTIRVECSKGTYIRTLCYDIGQKLGCGACMKALVRTKVSKFKLEDCVRLEDLENLNSINKKLINIDEMLEIYDKLYVNEIGEKQLTNGAKINLKNVKNNDIIVNNEIYRIYNTKNEFIALYKSVIEEEKIILRVEKMFL